MASVVLGPTLWGTSLLPQDATRFLVGYIMVVGYFSVVGALALLLVSAISLTVMAVRRKARSFLPHFLFSLFNAGLGLGGLLFVANGRI